MSQCPDCGRDLPGFQTLCSKCYDARYSDVGHPKSLLESIRQLGSNPIRRQVIEERIKAQAWWVPWCLALIGLAFDWRLAFEWLAGKSVFLSLDVLSRTGLIVAACASVALLAAGLTREAKWRDALPLFCAISMVVYRVLSTHWDVQRFTAHH